MQLDGLDPHTSSQERAPLQYLLINGVLRFLRCMLPFAAIPTFCVTCRTMFEMTREEVTHWTENCWVQGIRFWRCPNCGDRSEQSYTYVNYVDPNE